MKCSRLKKLQNCYFSFTDLRCSELLEIRPPNSSVVVIIVTFAVQFLNFIPYFLNLTPPAFNSNLALWTGVCLNLQFIQAYCY